jgi:hypothetical protein
MVVRNMEIERLYKVFARYYRRLSAVAMSADEDLETKKRLKHKRLRDLDATDALDATAYCADLRSFKHFLPRMFELGCRPEGSALCLLLKVNLESTRWETWPEEERAAIAPFRDVLGLE